MRSKKPAFEPQREPTEEQMRAMFAASKHRALRRIWDEERQCYWYWPFEQATHAEGAERLGVTYDRPPGAGDVGMED